MNDHESESPLDLDGLAVGSDAAAPPGSPPADPRSLSTVAPAWHTAILLLFLGGISWLSAASAPGDGPSTTVPRPFIYATVLVFQWMLFGIAYWGLRLRRVSIGSLISYRWRGWSGLGRCLLLAAGCWIIAFFAVAQGLDATGMRDPDEIRRVVEMIAPHGAFEIAIWIVVAVTAGFVEEVVFRGYLQRQFSAWTHHHIAGCAITALVFGAGHLYQGLASAALITIAGFAISLFAYASRSLAPGMVAHAFEDLISGIAGRG